MAEPLDRDLEALFTLDGAAGPARRIDPARSAAIIAAALRDAGFPPPGPGSGSSGSGGPQGAGPHAAARGAGHARRALFGSKRLLLLGAGAIAVAVAIGLAVRNPASPPPASTAAASAQLASTPPELGPLPSAHSDPAQAKAAPPTSAQPASARPACAQPAAAQSSSSRSASAAPGSPQSAAHSDPARCAPAPIDPPAEPAPAAPAHSGSGSAGPTHRRPPPHASPPNLLATPTPAHRRRIPPRPATVAAADPEDLLAEANAARLAHDWRSADALYTRVASTAGGALAAQTALVASAQLHLEHLGDPEGAARRFRRALATGARDTLAEDARWGLAEVARTTHDAAAERTALDDFLAHHASSVRASQARSRRGELEAQ